MTETRIETANPEQVLGESTVLVEARLVRERLLRPPVRLRHTARTFYRVGA